MTRDHQVLVRPDDKGCDAAVRCADPGLMRVVRRHIELETKPGACPADLLTDGGGVLAAAGGNPQAIEPAQRRRKRADMPCDVVAEEVYREARARLVAGQQLAEIRRHSGKAKHPRSAIKQV